MIVDDEVGRLQLIASLLEQNGFIAMWDRGGNMALRILDLVRPDIAIINADLQDIDSLELCKKVRAVSLEDQPPTRVLVLASHSKPWLTSETAGCVDDYLIMPFPAFELLVRVRKLLHLAAHPVADELKQTGLIC
jgi:DNA-binding response OmpR family regulator